MSTSPTHHIRGAGGKDGGGGALSESADTLRSVAYAQIIDLICEGEIDGFPTVSPNPIDWLQYVYFDGVPVTNADGTTNFHGATFSFRPGTQGQTHIEGYDDNSTEIAVGVEVKQTAAVVRTITDATIDAVRITLLVHSFYQLQSDGSMVGADIEYTIEVQSNAGGYVSVLDRHMTGKSSGEYERAHRLELVPFGPPPWDIRVSRITPDHDADTSIQDALWWSSFTEIVEAKFRFPNSALSAIKIDSSQFGHIPVRGYDLKLLRVQVPVNYDPATRAYTGSWDGTFKIAWTDNPAWCFYDLLTSERYGLGKYLTAAQVDKWALYAIGQYCDTLVDDGFGAVEPRFTCNIYMQRRQDAYTALAQFASIFRGMTYWGAGQLTTIEDAPTDPIALYANANVLGGSFTYSGASRRARHTVALVQWNNPANLYKQEIEYVEDRAGIARYGVVQTEVVAVGCTSRGQAHRVGRWLLYSERLETEIVTFRTGLDGIKARPGQVITIADANRAGSRRGGRIVAATTLQVTLDSEVTIDPAYTYTLHMIAPGGVLTSVAVTPPAQTTLASTITPLVALAVAPAAGAVWVLSGTDLAPTTWRVIGVTEPEKATYELTAVAHDPNKYIEIETGIQLQSPPTTILGTVPAAPTNLVLTQSAHPSGSSVSLLISASWSPVLGAQKYRVAYQKSGGNIVRIPDTETPHVDIPLSDAGTYTVIVRAVNGVGTRSPSIDASAYYAGANLVTLGTLVATAAATANGIDIAWAAVSNAESYKVERSSDGLTAWVQVAIAVHTVHWSDQITDGAIHYYRVTAVNHFGAASTPSSVVSATADQSSTARDYLNLGRPWALWRPTGAVRVGADDLSKHAEVTQHIGGLNIGSVNLDSQVASGTNFHRVGAGYADSSGRINNLWRTTGIVSAVDISKHSEVTQHIGGLGVGTVDFKGKVTGRHRGSLTTGADTTNIVSNPDFSTGDATGWTINPAHAQIVTAANAPTGAPTAYVAKLNTLDLHDDLFSGNTNTNLADGGTWMHVIPGQRIYVSCMAASDSSFNGNFYVGVHFCSATAQTGRYVALFTDAAHPWGLLAGYYTVPTGYYYAQFWASNQYSGTAFVGAAYLTLARLSIAKPGSDVTAANTAADTAKVNNVASTLISPIGGLMPAEAGADPTASHQSATTAALTGHDQDDLPDSTTRFAAVQAGADKTSTNTAAAIAGQGVLATKSAVDLSTAEVTNKTAANIKFTATGTPTVDSLMPAEAGSTMNLVPTQYPSENLFTDPHASVAAMWQLNDWTLNGSGGLQSRAYDNSLWGHPCFPLDGSGNYPVYKVKAGTRITIGATIVVTGAAVGNLGLICNDASGATTGYPQLGGKAAGTWITSTVLPAGTVTARPYIWVTGTSATATGSVVISDFFIRIASQTVIDAGGAKGYIDFGDDTTNGHVGKHLGNIADDSAGGRFAAITAKADKTSNATSADTAKVNNVASATVQGNAQTGKNLTVTGGLARVGDGRNLIALNSAGYATAYWTGVTMSSVYNSGANKSNVAATAGTLRVGGVSIAYNSWNVTGLSPSVLYYFALNDPSYAGGSPSVIYSTSKHTIIGADGYVYAGSYTTASSGSGGSGGIGGCVALSMWLAPNIRAARAHIGTRLACADAYQLVGTRSVNHMYYATEPCVRIEAANGAALVCSESTPFTVPDGSTVLAPEMQHQHVLTDCGDSVIQSVTPVGSVPVARISLGGLSFAAGEDATNRIYSHNTVK